jgi:hypothetical protein
VINITPWSLYTPETIPVSIEQEGRCVPELVSTVCKRDKSLAPAGIRTSGQPYAEYNLESFNVKSVGTGSNNWTLKGYRM